MKTIKDLNEEQHQSLYFYVRSDFLLINNLLWEDKSNLERSTEALYNEHKGMMNEALKIGAEKRFNVSKVEAEKILNEYKRRTPDNFNNQTRELMINIAKKDIQNIYNAMQPAENDMILYRYVHNYFALPNYNINKLIELKGFTSTCAILNDGFFGNETEFVRYDIIVKKGTPLIILENDYRNENEVLLMPAKYLIKSIRNSDVHNCRKIIELVLAN